MIGHLVGQRKVNVVVALFRSRKSAKKKTSQLINHGNQCFTCTHRCQLSNETVEFVEWHGNLDVVRFEHSRADWTRTSSVGFGKEWTENVLVP